MKGRVAEAQLALDLFNVTRHDFASFIVGPNREAWMAASAWASASGAQVLHLRGSPGTGKSHLLQAAIAAVDRASVRAMYVPLRELGALGANVLDDLDQIDVLAIDDIDACAGSADWERGLFNLYNALDAARCRLLWSARAAPRFSLPDLQSRLDASLIYQLHELDEADKHAALRARAHTRGLSLPESVIDFIMRRKRRDLGTLIALLNELDQASLASGRALTVPFVREVLAQRDD